MARAKRAGSGRLPGRGLRLPGLYRRLLEHERQVVRTPDPRWSRTDTGRRGEPCPKPWLRKSSILGALEAGEPVDLPTWRLGGRSYPDERLRVMPHADRSIVGWKVHCDDTVSPRRAADQ